MIKDLKNYEQSIKRKHSFAWTPKFEEEFHTNLNKTLVIAIATITFEKLEWDVVYEDEESIEAKRKNQRNLWTEKITVSYNCGKVKVKSVSLSGMWDVGKNSIRVKLFIHAFTETEKEFDKEALADLEKEAERANNWDDYVIPTELPQPKKRKNRNIWILAISATLTALLLGYALAYLSVEVVYLIGVCEFFGAFVFAFVFKYLVKWSNYTDFQKLKYILIGSIIIVCVSNQYFQYQIIINQLKGFSIGFFDFMKIRLEQGLQLESLNTGRIGFVVVWIFQFVLTYWISYAEFIPSLVKLQIERVPLEVVDFAYYHFLKGKTEEQVRVELSKMGWNEELDQDEVFESIITLQGRV